MTADPRAALSALVAALETHLETAAVRRGEDDPAVIAAVLPRRAAFVRSAADVLLGPPPGPRPGTPHLPDTPGSPASGTMER